MVALKHRTIESRQVFEGPVFRVRTGTIELSNGRVVRRDVVEHGGSVVMVPLDSRGRVLLIRQYRPAVGEELLELPAGTLHDGEDPVDCVQRELREEIGYRASTIRHLGGFYAAPGFCTEYLRLYLATGLKPDPLPTDEDEMITVLPTALSQIPRLIKSGEIQDAKTVAGLLIYLHLYPTPASTRRSRSKG